MSTRLIGGTRDSISYIPLIYTDIHVVNRSTYTGISMASHNVPYPSDIEEGNLLIMVARHGNAAWGINTPAGWDLLFTQTDTGSSFFFTRVADGTETGTVTITASFGNRNFAAIIYNIKNAKKVIDINLSVGSYDLPTSVLNWHNIKKLCIAVLSNVRTDNSVSSYPTNFIDELSIAASDNVGTNANVRVSVCNIYINEIETPFGSFSVSGTLNNPHVSTILII